MDELKEKYPEKFSESGAMNYEWFEKDIRPNFDVFARRDKMSVTHQFTNVKEFDDYLEKLKRN